jgi:hypothetical protein
LRGTVDLPHYRPFPAPQPEVEPIMTRPLQLLLFTTDPSFAAEADAAGVDGFLVDWENRWKQVRQDGYGMEVNFDTPADVRALRAVSTRPVAVRVDRYRRVVDRHVEEALDCGAGLLMLPMAETPADVERFVDVVAGRAETIIQIETQSLVERCAELRSIGWDWAYIGLNDLMVSRRGRWYWEPFMDGTLDRIVEVLGGRGVGVGAVTIIGGGAPMPFTHLFREMARLGCGLTFLRRAFKREMTGRDFAAEVVAIRAFWAAACARREEAVAADHAAFLELINSPACRPGPRGA